MARQSCLRPGDVPVALRLAQVPREGYEALADALGVSLGAAHKGVRRLEESGLVIPEAREVDHRSLLEFLVHGVRYAFYAVLGPEGRGVPTAHSAPPLAAEIVAETAYVWPSANGSIRGTTITPLYPGAPQTARTAPEVYRALALIDALRVGRVRERKLAAQHLETWLDTHSLGHSTP